MPITPVSYTPRPYVSGTSLGELLRLRGEHAADAELRRGAIAQQMWANLGQQLAGGIQNYAKEKQEAPIRKQEAETRTLNNQNARTQMAEDQRTIKGRDTENALAPLALKVGEDGVTTYDGDMLTRELTTAGFADRVPGVLKRLNDFQTSAAQFKKLQGELQATHVDALGNLAMTALEAGGTVTAARHALELVEPNGLLSKAEAEKALGGITDDAGMQAKLLEIAQQSPSIRQEMEQHRARRAVEAQTAVTQEALRQDRAEDNARQASQFAITSAEAERAHRDATAIQQQNADTARISAETNRARYTSLGVDSKIDPAYLEPLSRAIMSIPQVRQSSVANVANRLWAEGKTDELKDVIRQAAIESENVDLKNQVMGRATTIGALRDVRATLKSLQDKGVPTNWFAGSFENLARKLGATTNPEYVALSNQLMGTLINYRRAATGVQFSQPEQEQYAKMFPNFKNLPEVNMALLDGFDRQLTANDRDYWTHKLGADGAKLVGVGQDAPSSAKASTAAAGAPTEGATKPIDGFPGTEQTYRGGKWIRTK